MIEKQFLSPNELNEYKKLIRLAIYDTYYNRSVSFINLPLRYNKSRCLWCGQSLLYIKDKRKYRYCSSKCKEDFYFNFAGYLNDSKLLKREKYKCNICKKSIIYKEKTSYEIDHIEELARFKNNKYLLAEKFLSPENKQVLCVPCHRKKTASFLKNRYKKKTKDLKFFMQ